MTSPVVKVDKTVYDMLRELEHDLQEGDIVLVERLPPVRESEKYRDHILNILKEFHKAFIFVRIVFRDGSRRGYAIIISGEEGELGNIPEKGIVEGFIVNYSKDGTKTKIVYKEVKFSNSRELVQNLEKFAKLYHESEVRIIDLKLPEAYREHSLLY